jgi:hypothetical protein
VLPQGFYLKAYHSCGEDINRGSSREERFWEVLVIEGFQSCNRLRRHDLGLSQAALDTTNGINFEPGLQLFTFDLSLSFCNLEMRTANDHF